MGKLRFVSVTGMFVVVVILVALAGSGPRNEVAEAKVAVPVAVPAGGDVVGDDSNTQPPPAPPAMPGTTIEMPDCPQRPGSVFPTTEGVRQKVREGEAAILAVTVKIEGWNQLDASSVPVLGDLFNLIRNYALLYDHKDIAALTARQIGKEHDLWLWERCEDEWEAYLLERDYFEQANASHEFTINLLSALERQIEFERDTLLSDIEEFQRSYSNRNYYTIKDVRSYLMDKWELLSVHDTQQMAGFDAVDKATKATQASVDLVAQYIKAQNTFIWEDHSEMAAALDQATRGIGEIWTFAQNLRTDHQNMSTEHQDILDAIAAIPGGGGFSQQDRNTLWDVDTSTRKQEAWEIEQNLASCTALVSLYLPRQSEGGHLETVIEVVENLIGASKDVGIGTVDAEGYVADAWTHLNNGAYYAAYQALCNAYAELVAAAQTPAP